MCLNLMPYTSFASEKQTNNQQQSNPETFEESTVSELNMSEEVTETTDNGNSQDNGNDSGEGIITEPNAEDTVENEQSNEANSPEPNPNNTGEEGTELIAEDDTTGNEPDAEVPVFIEYENEEFFLPGEEIVIEHEDDLNFLSWSFQLPEIDSDEELIKSLAVYYNDKLIPFSYGADYIYETLQDEELVADGKLVIKFFKPTIFTGLEINYDDNYPYERIAPTEIYETYVGESAYLSVDAELSNGGTLAYQWQFSDDAQTWTNVTEGNGGNTATYTTEPLTIEQNGRQYRCVVTNPISVDGSASAISPARTLKIAQPAQQVKIKSFNQGIGETDSTVEIIDNELYEMSVDIEQPSEKGTIYYKWLYKDEEGNVSTTGNNTSILKEQFPSWYSGYRYYCQVFNDLGNGNVSITTTELSKPIQVEEKVVSPVLERKVAAGDKIEFTAGNRKDNHSPALGLFLVLTREHAAHNFIEDVTVYINDVLTDIEWNSGLISDEPNFPNNDIGSAWISSADSPFISGSNVRIEFHNSMVIQNLGLDYEKEQIPFESNWIEKITLTEGEAKNLEVKLTSIFNAELEYMDANLKYQWQTSPDMTIWTDIEGASQETYTVNTDTDYQQGTYFRLKVTNSLEQVKNLRNVPTVYSDIFNVALEGEDTPEESNPPVEQPETPEESNPPVEQPGTPPVIVPNPPAVGYPSYPVPSPSPEPSKPTEPTKPVEDPKPSEPVKPSEPPVQPIIPGLDNHPKKEDIEYLIGEGVLDGIDEELMLDDKMTRGLFVTVLSRMNTNEVIKGYKNPFKDVQIDDYYYNATAWAVNNEIVKGKNSQTFAPDDLITRQEMAVMLINYIDFASKKLNSTEKAAFKDVARVSSWAKESVSRVQAYDLMIGNRGNWFAPLQNATNMEGLLVFNRMYKALR